MTSQSLIIAVILLICIVGFEIWRRYQGQTFGLLTVANAVFALNFCVSPLLLMLLPGTRFETGPFGHKLFMLPIAETFGLSGDDYLKASMMTVFAYGVMIGAYTLVFRYKRLAPLDSAAVRVKWLVVLGSGLALLAIVALFLYSAQFQMVSYPAATQYHIDNAFVDPFGIVKMMKYGGLVRGGHLDASLGFLQVIIMLGVPAMMMLSTAALMSKPVWRWVLFAAATIAWLTVLARVYHASGRMELTVILTMVPLAILLRVRSLKLAVLGGGALLIFGFLMVLARQNFFPEPGQGIGVMVDALAINTGRSIFFLFNEFAFPFPVSANTLQIVPEVIHYRYFIDVPLAMLYMLPSLGGVDAWPEMISHIHNRTVPAMLPYDLISFGFYSAGLIGVGAAFAALGALLAVFDAWLAPGTGWLGQILRAAWMMYLPFRIMYADPYTSMKTGFGLIVGTVLILILAELSKRRKGGEP